MKIKITKKKWLILFIFIFVIIISIYFYEKERLKKIQNWNDIGVVYTKNKNNDSLVVVQKNKIFSEDEIKIIEKEGIEFLPEIKTLKDAIKYGIIEDKNNLESKKIKKISIEVQVPEIGKFGNMNDLSGYYLLLNGIKHHFSGNKTIAFLEKKENILLEVYNNNNNKKILSGYVLKNNLNHKVIINVHSTVKDIIRSRMNVSLKNINSKFDEIISQIAIEYAFSLFVYEKYNSGLSVYDYNNWSDDEKEGFDKYLNEIMKEIKKEINNKK